MIAMALMALIGLYVVLFIVVGFVTKQWLTRLTGWGILLAPLIWKTWDIPLGQYHFNKLCEAEAGFKVNVPNPVPAKIIRLDSYSYTADHASSMLRKRPSVIAVEAKDKKYDYLSHPVAFALYERDLDGNIASRLLDKVGQPFGRGEIQVIESAPSNADYIVTETLDYPGDRMSRWHQELRYKDGTTIASSTSLEYMWSNPANTLFAQSYRTVRCGSWDLAEEFRKLLDLIAPRAQ